ncbi:MAG: radical SAM protein [Syntrophales bacterium]|nr:radical SAM protein [Syntrophales bacterium]
MQLIIPVFATYQGCPHRCIFCDQEKTAGQYPERITREVFEETVLAYLHNTKRKADRIQIAFYGGNFTGMEEDYQLELLGFAHSFIRRGMVDTVRISTRPDYIAERNLDMLERLGVTTVEIGAQSMDDEVLNISRRGHSSADVGGAVKMLKKRGFETGIHLMVGLPGDSRERFAYTVDKTIALRPDMVRIHPTLVFQGTALAKAFQEGSYVPLSMSDAIAACKFALRRFAGARIPVIRLGLQVTPEMVTEGSIIAGPFHPAFRSLVEEAIFFDMASSMLSSGLAKNGEVTFSLSPKDVSSFRGQKNRNIQRLKDFFGLAGILMSVDHAQKRGSLAMTVNGKKSWINGFHDVKEMAGV